MAEDTSEPGLQRAVLRPTRACRRFDERRPQPVVALPGLARLVFAGAFIVSRTERRPTREMGGGGKRALSTPTSAMMTSAVRRLMPGMLSRRFSWSAHGARC